MSVTITPGLMGCPNVLTTDNRSWMTRGPGGRFEDVADLVSGVKGREVLETGNLEAGIYWAGMSQGLIDDIPACGHLLDRIEAEATAIIGDRLPAMMA